MTAGEGNESAAKSQQDVPNVVSRRDFVRLTTATGLAALAGQSSLTAQESPAPARSSVAGSAKESLPKREIVRMYEGTAAGAVVEQLRACGVRRIFHTNTSGFSSLWDAVYAARDIQVMMVTHEGQGVAAAEGYAMASKTLGLFVGSQVGVGNAMSNLYNAWKDRTPMIVLFGRAGLNEQGGMDGTEEWDGHLKPTEPFTTWNWSCIVAETLPDVIRRAIKFAFGPPSGPVTLDMPAELQAQRIKAPIHRIDLSNARATFRAKPDLIQRAAQWLAEAQDPLFILGPEISQEGANDEIVALAEKLSVPVSVLGWPNELAANFPTDHPLFVGAYRGNMRFPRNVDLLINFGEKFAIRPPQGVPTIHISSDPDILGKVFTTDLVVASEIRTAIQDLSAALDGILTNDRISRIRSARLAEVSTFTGKLKQSREQAMRGRFDASPLSWERVGYELNKALDKDAVIVPELGTAGGPRLLGQFTFGKGNKLRIGRTTGSALGWGVAAAFGVNVALPDRQVVALQGDGGVLFGQTETLWSIARYDAPMLIVVMNNHSYNDTRNRAIMTGGLLSQSGIDFTSYLGTPDIDFTKIAEAYSMKGEKVRTPADLAPALQTAVKTMRDGKAFLLDVEVAPEGFLTESKWYQRNSIAEARRKA